MKKTNFIIGLSVLVVILLFMNFAKINDSSIPDDYNEMTAGQLLDVKIDYDTKIQTLKDKRQTIINLYNVKRWYVKTGNIQNTGSIEETGSAIDMANEALGLE